MSTREAYDAWIATYVASQPDGYVRGKCAHATQAMVEAFPELKRQAGFVHVDWGRFALDREQHWWCVTPDGEVVDPTVSQFHFGYVHEYEPLDLDNPADVARIPTGKCSNCGGPIYNHYDSTVCSDECHRSYCAYLNGV